MAFDIFSDKKIAGIINKWLLDESEEFSYKNLGESILTLLIDMELAKRGILNADEIMRNQIQKELIEKNKLVPKIGGDQTVGQEVIYKILIEDFDNGIGLLINNQQEKEINIKEYISETQRKKAQQPRPNALNELLIELLEDDPNISEPEVRELLENGYNRNIYISDPDLGITIETHDGNKSNIKYAKISGLKNRLSELRLKMRSK
jgi:hypothetical protein